jgi:TetR/AcrR family transcriptional repressor of lmrAB and yxaGH operons
VPRIDDSRTLLVGTMARLLRDQGYTATGLAQLLAESGVSNGSLYHHFPGGMEELAVAALETSGKAVADALSQALDNAPNTGEGMAAFLDIAQGPAKDGICRGCPIAPTALESSIISPRLRTTATRCFDQWEDLLAGRLRADGLPEHDIPEAASAALSLIEGALLLARVTGQISHLANAKKAARTLFANTPAAPLPPKTARTRRRLAP